MGIVNGTTNYILTKMHEDNREFAECSTRRRRRSVTPEADPTADVEGHDAAAKAAVLSAALPSTPASLSMRCTAKEFRR
jgi:homoserine dehydrogenase